MKKIIVTGGAGFIGSHTVVELVEAGFDPIILDNFSNSSKRIPDQIEKITGRKVVVHEVDCTREQEVFRVMEAEGPIAGVVHFAAFKAVGESVEEPLKYYETNVGSLIVIMKAIEKFNVPSFVFSSSCTVYGEQDHVCVDENTPRAEPSSPYGSTKRVGEDIIVESSRAGKVKQAALLRYFNPIGAHPSGLIGELPLGKPTNLVPYITQTAAGHLPSLTVFGNDYNTPDGTCIRDYVHVVDLAKAHVRTLEWLMQQGETRVMELFNLGTGKGSSVKEVIDAFESATAVSFSYSIGDRRSGDIPQIYADVSKAQSTLGWKAELSLEDALSHAWKWQCYLDTDW